jgi:hypothetical protein
MVDAVEIDDDCVSRRPAARQRSSFRFVARWSRVG